MLSKSTLLVPTPSLLAALLVTLLVTLFTMLFNACGEPPPSLEPMCTRDCDYRASLAPSRAELEDGELRGLVELDGYLVLDAAGRATELSAIAAPITLGDSTIGPVSITLDRDATAESVIAGGKLNSTFGVTVHTPRLGATSPLTDQKICSGGEHAGLACTADADCADASGCLLEDACHCATDFRPSPTIACTAALEGSLEADRVHFAGALVISCAPNAGFTGLRVQTSLGATIHGAIFGHEDCPEEKKVPARKVCIQPIVIARDGGAEPTSCPSFDEAIDVLGKCCVSLDVKEPRVISRLALKTLRVNRDGTLSGQESEMFAADNDDASAAGCIEVYCPDQLSYGTEYGKDVDGGGHCFFGGTANAKVTIVDGAAGGVLAHELGHALGLLHENGTFMEPTGHHDVEAPDTTGRHQCDGMSSSPNVRLDPPAHDCCLEHDVP